MSPPSYRWQRSSVVEQGNHNPLVGGSNPSAATILPLVRPGEIGNGSYRRHRLQPWAERVVYGLQGFLLQIDEAEIVAHEADDPNSFVDFFYAETLAGQDVGDVDPLAVHADASAMGDHDFAKSGRRASLCLHAPSMCTSPRYVVR